MKGNRNPNHPKKGQMITVDPIRDIEKLREIKRLLADQPRNLLLFTLAINSGIRVGDLLRLRVKDFKCLGAGEFLRIRESKTGKINVLKLKSTLFLSYTNLVKVRWLQNEDFLFKSRKGDGALTIQAVNNLVKKWTASVGLDGNYGAHSLRKTWGYHQRKTYGVGFELIARRFNHSNPAVTMRYLGIEDSEVEAILGNEIG